MKTIVLFLLALAGPVFAQGEAGIPKRGAFLKKKNYSTPGDGVVVTYFVDPTGNDANACTASGVNACLTIQGAINRVPKLLRDGVTISIAAGSYTGYNLSGFTWDTGVAPATGGILIEGALIASTLATGSATGTATGAGQSAGSGSTFGVLCDSTQTWTVNDLRGRFVTTVAPANANFVISSNTATCVTVVGTWTLPVAGSTTYTIQDPSVIINANTTQPGSPLVAGSSTRSAVFYGGNLMNTRSTAIFTRYIRIANTVGTSIEINDSSQYRFEALQLRPTFVTASGIFFNTAAQFAGSAALGYTKSDISVSSTNGGLVIGSGIVVVTNSLFRNAASANGSAVQIGTGFGSLGQMTFSASETLGYRSGLTIRNGGGQGGTLNGNRIDCGSAAGIGIEVGSSTVNLAGPPAYWTPIATNHITTCAIALQVVGPASADVTSMTGSVATTGFAVSIGGLVTFAPAAVTLTAGTNEISLDSGGATAAFADVTAGTCLSTGPMGSRVCAR